MANKKTTKTILKTVAAGFACAMCTAFFPAGAVANALENYTTSEQLKAVNTISIDTGSDAAEQQSLTVKKGEVVSIPEASFSYKPANGGDGVYEITNDGKEDAENLSSTIVVTEKNSGNKVVVTDGTFRAEKVGTYVVTYTVKHGDNEFSYDLEIVSQATSASFDFEGNVENAIPNVYDIAVANGKDVVIPLPTVMGEDEKVLVANEKANFVTNEANATSDVYVKLSLANAGSELAIESKTVDGKEVYVVAGDKLSAKTDEDYTFDGKTLKVVYSFYQKVDDKAVFVASTSKSFTVKANHYYKDSSKKEAKYDLVATFASSFPDSAKVGVEVTLPGVVGTTSSTNAPANEGVETYYTIQVLKADENNKYTEDVTETVISEGNKFKAVEEGSYKFVYTVKDFYGNIADSDKVTRIITNVKDSTSATPYMYDAVDGHTVVDGEDVYTSAETLMKSHSANSNIIMYAIAGKDNMPSNEITLRREVRNYLGRTEFVIDEEAYHAYNLVFAPTLKDADGYGTAEAKENALYKQIVSDNFALASQMTLQGKDAVDAAAIKEFMAGKYLLVTTQFNKDAFGQTIDESITGEDDETAIEKMMAKGYAYIAPEEGRNGEFTEQTYNFYYFANDNKNKEASIKKDIEISSDYSDNSAPTLTFSSDLQASYLSNDKFTFAVAKATEETKQDSRLKVITAYRFVNENKEAITSDVTPTAIKYLSKADGIVDAGKWYVNEEESEYTVDLAKRPEGTAYVEIFAYSIDDFGNVGKFTKYVAVADATDTDMMILKSVKNAPAQSETFSAPKDITLPTLTFTDKKANFITAKVVVTQIEDAKGNAVNQVITSKNMSTKVNSYLGTYTVDAGYFRASVGGKYQVAITVVDAGNHSVTSFFTYDVADRAQETLAPTIDNISSREETVKPGKALYLTPPSISLSKEEGFGYIGLEADDDTNTATWYNVEAIEASTNDYKILNNLYFTAGSEGTYKLKYTAYLMKYAKNKVSTTQTASGLYINENGQLCYQNDEQIVYIDTESDQPQLAIVGLGSVPTEVSEVVTAMPIPCESIITVTVSGASLTINDSEMDLHYNAEKTEYDVYDATKPETHDNKIEIIKPIVDSDGTTSVAAENTTVTITRNSTTLATIKLSDWAKTKDINLKDYFEVDEENDKIALKFVKDGKYTITYTVAATVGANDTYTTTLSAGDTIAPELEIGADMTANKFKVGQSLHIAFSHTEESPVDKDMIKVSDKETAVKDLLESLVVKIKFEGGETTTLSNNADKTLGKYDYTYDFKEKGTYTLSLTVTDKAGNVITKTKEIEVGADESKSINTTEVMGGVLIGLSVALLAGVVIYFVVSKKKLDSKEKSFKSKAGRK